MAWFLNGLFNILKISFFNLIYALLEGVEYFF